MKSFDIVTVVRAHRVLGPIGIQARAAGVTETAVALSVTSVTAAYRRILRSVFHRPRAVTMGAVNPLFSAIS